MYVWLFPCPPHIILRSSTQHRSNCRSHVYWLTLLDHSHNLGQYPDGLRGPFIVHDPEDPYADQYDEEIILTVSDWYVEDLYSQNAVL